MKVWAGTAGFGASFGLPVLVHLHLHTLGRDCRTLAFSDCPEGFGLSTFTARVQVRSAGKCLCDYIFTDYVCLRLLVSDVMHTQYALILWCRAEFIPVRKLQVDMPVTSTHSDCYYALNRSETRTRPPSWLPLRLSLHHGGQGGGFSEGCDVPLDRIRYDWDTGGRFLSEAELSRRLEGGIGKRRAEEGGCEARLGGFCI